MMIDVYVSCMYRSEWDVDHSYRVTLRKLIMYRMVLMMFVIDRNVMRELLAGSMQIDLIL